MSRGLEAYGSSVSNPNHYPLVPLDTPAEGSEGPWVLNTQPIPLPLALRMSNRKPKDWWWGYFDTHPDFEKKLPVAYTNEKERQLKVMCGACRIRKMIDEQQKDCKEQHQGL
ncbi:hypothetical protein EDB19DRAFT_1835089 [Suillus lakei]|nr:hypothetical protein EDB19DRAFT_1835089 [Suillus lakei]